MSNTSKTETEHRVVDASGRVLLRTTSHTAALAFYRNNKKAVRIDCTIYDLW